MWFDLVIFMAVVRAIQLLFRRRTSPQLGSDGLLKLNVGRSFRALYGGNIYQALRIPDTGGRGHQLLDVLLLTEQELYIFSVQGLSGTVRTGRGGVWLETDSNGNEIEHPNAVTELKDKAAVLTQYMARRGVMLPKDFIKFKVVFVNEMARPEQDILLVPEVLSYDRWQDIQKKASSSSILGIETAISTARILSTSPLNHLHYVLSTAPTWDRLELREGGILFGEFLRFKGPMQDVEALAVAKRSKISHYEAIHKWSVWAFLGVHTVADVKVVCYLRDHRQGSSVQPTKVDIEVRGNLELIFQAEGTGKPRAFELRDVALLTLHA
ncbi:hypothetical protein GOP47_0005352 [Adiantum capillus-veneris]|uniref:NERD domain-containing protein n=1 Tax=Adiantum capillus-veneris TaxID=13818 RepID=A0A9D4V568_ADICA|nr:hypothetical protein GOP47_0005352 [Adiantum capillus-veneris]